MILFGYLLKNKKQSLKKFFISVSAGIIAYIPWLFYLVKQLEHPSNTGMGEVTLFYLFKILGYGITISKDNLIIVFFSIVMMLIMAFVIKNYLTKKDIQSFYLLSGILILLGTIAVVYMVSILFKPMICERYFIPCFAVFWFVFSIYISKLNNRKLMLLLTCVILLVGAVSINLEYDKIVFYHKDTLKSFDLIDNINNNDSIIVYGSNNRYTRLHSEFTKVYTSSIIRPKKINNSSNEFNSYLNQNKHVYYIVFKKIL